MNTQTTFISADEYLYNTKLAEQYVEMRIEDAIKFAKSIKWESDQVRFRFAISADLYGARIIHDMAGTMSTIPVKWGELFIHEKDFEVKEHLVFDTYYNFVAYMLAKYW